ncbi:DUF6518 family protein [Rhodococcus sp. MEB064]|uniref:DUF6518 family protein n=1 Tax=Rhodococcus sp. MEB064 TaxID=1587522 RepID=UPI0012E005B7|nr:DUF6518 family protein [Rhodococcus sp. MEB064]
MPTAIAVGILTGLLAATLFAVMPSPWDALANTSALWGLVPFAVASRSEGGRGVLLGVASMLALVGSWIVLAPSIISGREVLVFLVAGLAAGAVCGAAGGALRGSRRVIGTTVMAGLVLGEAVYGLGVVGGPQWLVEAAIGVAVVLLACRTTTDRARAGLGSVAVAVGSFGLYALYDAIDAA